MVATAEAAGEEDPPGRTRKGDGPRVEAVRCGDGAGLSKGKGRPRVGFFDSNIAHPVGEDMGSSLPRRVSRVVTKDYDRVSRVWDRTFVPATDDIRRHLLDAARLRPGERVLDVGTGTGAAALLAARRVGKTGHVLGIDMSPGMLAKARAKASRSGLANVTFRRMDGAKLRLPKESFDVILSSFGTPEGLYDGEAVFRDWLRVLRPGGRLPRGADHVPPVRRRAAERARDAEIAPELGHRGGVRGHAA